MPSWKPMSNVLRVQKHHRLGKLNVGWTLERVQTCEDGPDRHDANSSNAFFEGTCVSSFLLLVFSLHLVPVEVCLNRLFSPLLRVHSLGVGVVVCVGSYLVDPASSHMLVSKIKPCMSKYKQLLLWNCEWLIKSVIVYLIVLYYMDTCGNSRANTCEKSRLLEGMYLLD